MILTFRHLPFAPLWQKRAHFPSSGLAELSPGHRQHIEIPARKYGVQPISFFSSPDTGFCVIELALDKAKGTLRLAAD
ncbi:MAG: hypothetical protein RSF73_10165, partial [Ruthenibacterium sp.]